MRACIYARVSSTQQRDANTIAAQLAALPEYATRQGWRVVQTYIDDGHSARAGNLANRRGLSSLLSDATARPRPWDVVLVWDLDRLSRSEDQGERGHILKDDAYDHCCCRPRNTDSNSALVTSLQQQVADLRKELAAPCATCAELKARWEADQKALSALQELLVTVRKGS